MRIIPRILAAGALAAAASAPAYAQERGAAFLEHALRGITTTARVLIIGAHPDDDATSLVAFLSRGRHVETAYLSLTRGEGAQNYIGLEGGESLGALRTEELLAARRIDGARQFFTRAFDFGSSKTAEETWKHWPRDELLGDVVTVIRAFRPHVIVSAHSGTPADSNGHHEVAGILAREAFEVSGDTTRFPVLRNGARWQATSLYGRGTSIAVSVDEYDEVTGRTLADVAAESRAQHRSQGFGGMALDSADASVVRLDRVATRVTAPLPEGPLSLFDGIDTSFARLGRLWSVVATSLALLQVQVDSARAVYRPDDPQAIVRHLAIAAQAAARARAVTRFCRHPDADAPAFISDVARCDTAMLDVEASVDVMKRRLAMATLAAAGVVVRASAPRELVAFRDVMPVTVTVSNHGRDTVQLESITVTGMASAWLQATIPVGGALQWTGRVRGLVGTDPWWTGRREKDLFPQQPSALDGRARLASTIGAVAVPGVSIPEDIRRTSDLSVSVNIAGTSVVASLGPISFDAQDAPVLGQRALPIGGVPSVTLALDRNLEFVPISRPLDRLLRLTMTSWADSSQIFTLSSVAPPGLRVDSLPDSVTLAPREQREMLVRLRGSLKAGRYEFGIIGRFPNGLEFAEGMRTIQYPHVRPLHLMRSSGEYMQALDVTVPAQLSVAYIQGLGDQVIPYLRQLGVRVDPLSTDDLAGVDLAKFTTIVVGARAYEAHPELVAYNARLLDFARRGGTLVVQGGTTLTYELGVFPYPISVPPDAPAQRVTEERAPVQVLDPAARVFTWPNRIGDDDWAGWVQERASFLPSAFDSRYAAPLAVNDPGEPPNPGAILVAPLGKGKYVYTTLALFRQLPGGVPGAARLFVNLMSAGLSPTATSRAPRR